MPSPESSASRISAAWSSFFLQPMHVLCGTCPDPAAGRTEFTGSCGCWKADGDPAMNILPRFFSLAFILPAEGRS